MIDAPGPREGLDQIFVDLSAPAREACSALDYNSGAFERDSDFLARLSSDLHMGQLLPDKVKTGWIRPEDMQIAMDALKRLPQIPCVQSIIDRMRTLLSQLGIEEVDIVIPDSPQVGDSIFVQLRDGEMVTKIDKIEGGKVFFHDGTTRAVPIENLRFTHNLHIAGATGTSLGEGWTIVDPEETEI